MAKRARNIILIVCAAIASCYAGAVSYVLNIAPAPYIMEAWEGGEYWLKSLNEPSWTTTSGKTPSEQETKASFKIMVHKPGAYEGYNLINTNTNITSLVDMQGNIIYQWNTPFLKVFSNYPHVKTPTHKLKSYIVSTHLYGNGDLLVNYHGANETPYGYGLAKVDKNSRVLWNYPQNTHHQIHLDSQGKIYALAQQLESPPFEGFDNIRRRTLVDYIVILSPEGKELKKISLLDAFRKSRYAPSIANIRTPSWDLTHANSVVPLEPSMAHMFPMFKPGYLLVSINTMSTIAVIDPDTEEVVWAARGKWKLQHTASFLNNGRILLFDNVGGGFKSRVLMIDPQSKRPVWVYGNKPGQRFFTYSVGGVWALPNGNMLIMATWRSRILEITPMKELVWEARAIPDQRQRIITPPPFGISHVGRYAAADLPFLSSR